MFNDGFCDLCHVFQGHEDLLTMKCSFGNFLVCVDCLSKLKNLETPKDKEAMIRKMLGLPSE